MRRYFILLVVAISALISCQFVQNAQAQENSNWNKLSESYDEFRYEGITHRRFKHKDIMLRIDELDDAFQVSEVGMSNEGLPIKMISFGGGPVNVLYWSQMHGNEPTATMAIMDVMGWMEQQRREDNTLHQLISEQLTVHFIPMLNPDGSNLFQRRNLQGIDINRDALRLQTPEGRTLKRVRDSLEADWGFNLHDQGRSTSAESRPATISFLAPAYDEARNVNEKREDAMQLIASFNEKLQKLIPGQVGRYWDAFEPRAFGDNIQKWGTRTILIESGGHYKDREKQYIRKLNYLLITSSMMEIAEKSYEEYTQEQYFQIPGNSRGMRDVIIKNLELPEELGGYVIDLAIDFTEVENSAIDDIYLKARVTDIGDLSTSDAYILHDMSGYQIRPGKTYENPFESNQDVRSYGQMKLLNEGYCHVKVENPDFFDDQLILHVNGDGKRSVELGSNPALLFYKDDELKKVLINGLIIDTTDDLAKALVRKKEL